VGVRAARMIGPGWPETVDSGLRRRQRFYMRQPLPPFPHLAHEDNRGPQADRIGGRQARPHTSRSSAGRPVPVPVGQRIMAGLSGA